MFVCNLHSQLIKKLLNNTVVASVFVIALEEREMNFGLILLSLGHLRRCLAYDLAPSSLR